MSASVSLALLLVSVLVLLSPSAAQLTLGDGRVVFTNQTVGAFYISDLRLGTRELNSVPGLNAPIINAVPWTDAAGVHTVYGIANPSKAWHPPVSGVSTLFAFQGGSALKILSTNVTGVALAVDGAAGYVFANFGGQLARFNLQTWSVDMVLEPFPAQALAADVESKWIYYTNPNELNRNRIWRRNYDGNFKTLVLDQFAYQESIMALQALPNSCIMYLVQVNNPMYSIYVTQLRGWCYLTASNTFSQGNPSDTAHISSFTYDRRSRQLYLSVYSDWYNLPRTASLVRTTLNPQNSYSGSQPLGLTTIAGAGDLGSMHVSQALQCGTDCSGNGVCQSGSCTCLTNFFGSDCAVFCRAKSTCNDHGDCSSDGTCLCTLNYAGVNCETQLNFPHAFPSVFGVHVDIQTPTETKPVYRTAQYPVGGRQDTTIFSDFVLNTQLTELYVYPFIGQAHVYTYDNTTCVVNPAPDAPPYQMGGYVNFAGLGDCADYSCVEWVATLSGSFPSVQYWIYENMNGAYMPFNITRGDTTWNYDPQSWTSAVDPTKLRVPSYCPKPQL